MIYLMTILFSIYVQYFGEIEGKQIKHTVIEIESKKPYEEILSIIKKYEGFVDTPYYCLSNQKTIGYGHILLKGEDFTKISETEADSILFQDFVKMKMRVDRQYPNVEEKQKLLLTLLFFSVGEGKIRKGSFSKNIHNYSVDILYEKYLSFSNINGKRHKLLYERRKIEFKTIYK
jgi:GH24 family phage-related lysozyme (muramidase)